VTSPVGYSGKPLAAKLGIGPESRVLLVAAPDGFALGAPAGAAVHNRPGRGPYDVVLAFCPDEAALRRRFAPLAGRLTTAGALWISWPKRSSGVRTDLDENVVRDHGLAVGLVDVKVAAVDATWSGLKFVRRLSDRPGGRSDGAGRSGGSDGAQPGGRSAGARPSGRSDGAR
jgi:hypothetical protein